MQLGGVPLWLLWVMAMVGVGVMFGAVAAILPPEKRGWSGAGLAGALALFVARALVSRNPRFVLWFAFSLGIAAGFSLLALVVPHGRRAYLAMSYRDQWNRGFLAAGLFVGLLAVVITCSVLWVR